MLKAQALAGGGWDALQNITRQIGASGGPRPSTFFPTAQRERIQSEILQPAGAAGKTFRKVRYEMQSVLLTNAYRQRGWVGSPYAKELAVATKRSESKGLAALISGGRK